MLRITRLALLSFSVLFCLADCAKSSSSSSSTNSSNSAVIDTLGVNFALSCSSAFFCTLTSQDSNATATSCDGASGTDTFVLLWSRILTAHVLNLPTYDTIEVNGAEPSHPIACTSDADCYSPGADDYGDVATYACQNGLCQATQLCISGVCDTDLSTNDVLTLCQADIPWPKYCPYITLPLYAHRIEEVAANCGSNTYCSNVPSDCRQPVVSAAADGGTPVGGEIALDGGVIDGEI